MTHRNAPLTLEGRTVRPVVDHQNETRAAYDGVVELYASLFANRLEEHCFSRAMIGTFECRVRSRTSDGHAA
ncbi:hypothetical protein EES41_40335 (plasmid) [Streptomyces sp. ADI95-16]|nr:hypothetical protein EES41_40335 [Streptomyces sp. ADI95-16]